MSLMQRNWSRQRGVSDVPDFIAARTEYLGHGTERLQVSAHAHPKHPQRIQTDRDGDVVDDAAPEVAALQAYIALLVGVGSLHDDGGQRQWRLEPRILQDAALDREERVWIADVHFWEDEVQRPDMFLGRPSVHHDDQGALAAQEVDEELEERVDGEGLIDVSDRIEELGRREGHERHPGRNGVDGDHEQNAHHIALEQRFSVVLSTQLSAKALAIIKLKMKS